jgi:hypothetical protein
MKIDANGNVGIGTPSPASKLHLKGGSLTIDDLPLDWTDAHWRVALNVPNGSVWRTNNKGTYLNKYLGFGMSDDGGGGGWYWIASCSSDDSQPAISPMSLTLDQSGKPTLIVKENGWCDYVFNENYIRL